MADTNHAVVPAASTVPARTLMHPLVERMLGSNPTPEALEKILTLQREWEAGEAKRAYTSALVELKRALPPFLVRDKKVSYLKVNYTNTSLAGAMETVQPHLAAYGFSLTWRPGTDAKGGVSVTAILTHRQGHSEEATLSSPPDMSGSKSAAQGIASTITLLQRYSALAILGLATADMHEPVGATVPDAEDIDTARNMRAMADLVQGGKTRMEIEGYVGKLVSIWTAADLDKLREWVKPPEASINSADSLTLKKIMDEFKLTPVRMLAIVSGEIGREIKGSQEIKASELPKIVKAFALVRDGLADLKGDHIEHPPA